MYILTVKFILLEKLYKSLKTISMIYCIYSIQRLNKAEDWYEDTRVCTHCPLCLPAFQWPASSAVCSTTLNFTNYIHMLIQYIGSSHVKIMSFLYVLWPSR
jgi:hypothetical protein